MSAPTVTPSTKKSSTSLQMQRTFNVPRARVYQAWTDPTLLSQWFHPAPKMTAKVAEMDLRVGGRYAISMQAEGGDFTVMGTYKTIQPPEKLVFTWRWSSEDPSAAEEDARMLITVEFRAISTKQTEMTLRHERFVSEEERDNHEWGWNGTLGQLELLLNTHQ